MPSYKMRSGWGHAASPVVHKGAVYVVNDNEEDSYLASFDAKTGKERWRVPREKGSSWVTPYVWQNAQRTEIVTVGLRKVTSYDLDGRLLWELTGVSTLSIPTPFAADDLLFVNSGFRIEPFKPVYAIRPGASGDISLPKEATSSKFVAWSNPTLGTYNPSSIVYRGIHYALYDTSLFAANDARTGADIYGKQRISADSTGFTASPWAYNGKIFVLSEDGDTFVLQAGPEFKVIGKNSLNEMTLATPAVADGSVFIRTASRLYRIGRKK
jgi:outer membrane protein assembly factor BamB